MHYMTLSSQNILSVLKAILHLLYKVHITVTLIWTYHRDKQHVTMVNYSGFPAVGNVLLWLAYVLLGHVSFN